MAYGLQIVSTWLFYNSYQYSLYTDSFVCVDARVTGCACKVFTLTVGDVLPVWISKAFSETEIDNEYAVLCLIIATYQEIIWFDISMNDSFFMHFFYAFNLYQRSTVIFITIYMPTKRTVFRSNYLLHAWNKSSRLGPRRSITITWKCCFSIEVSVPT